MAFINANGTRLAYERYGTQGAPPVLLIMGLGSQLTYWPKPFIEALVGSEREVIAFDNRDIGLSQKWGGREAPNPFLQMALQRLGRSTGAPYSLSDMADDTIGLIDALGFESVDLIGVSLGGMISQFVAAKAPHLIRTFTGIMTTTGNPKHPLPSLKIMRNMARRGPRSQTKAEIIERTMNIYRLIGTPGEDHEANGLREKVTNGYERSYDPAGYRRQLAASIESGYLIAQTRKIKAPTLIIHGSVDPLVSIEGGKEIARTIPGADLMVLDGMGHDLPPRFLDAISTRVIAHLDRAETKA